MKARTMRNRGVVATGCLVLVCMVVAVQLAGASEIVLYPTDDAFLYQRVPDSSFGSIAAMSARNRYGHPSHEYYWEKDALVRFDLSSIPSGSMISNATLHVFYYRWSENDPAGRELDLYRVTSDWDESTVTWNTQPDTAAQPCSFSIVPADTLEWMVWPVTSEVQEFVQGTALNYGWMIKDTARWDDYNIPSTYFRTKEYDSCHPYLVVEYQGIDSVSPVPNQLNVDSSTDITAYFSWEMDETTIDSSTFLVSGRSAGPLSGQLWLPRGKRMVRFDPHGMLPAGEVVTATLTSAMESVDGIPLDGGYTWSFTVEAEGSGCFDFELAAEYSVGVSPGSIFAADLDGQLGFDLVTANALDNTVSVLLSTGGGTFASAVSYPTGGYPWGLYAADVNGDGYIDLVTANQASSVSILPNLGNGTFGSPSHLPSGGSAPENVVAADLDGDGDLDLAVPCPGQSLAIADSVVSIFCNDGGTFVLCSTYVVDLGPVAVAADDLDGDGDVDLTVMCQHSDCVTTLMNNGDASFSIGSSLAVGQDPINVVSGDFNGDALVDLAVASGSSSAQAVTVLGNTGDGTFVVLDSLNLSPFQYSIEAGDLDGDGDLDLATVRNLFDGELCVHANDGQGRFTPNSLCHQLGSYPLWVFTFDLNQDGQLDLVASDGHHNEPGTLYVFTSVTSCCNHDGIRGDVNYDFQGPNIVDLTFLVAHLFGGGPAPPCFEEGDVNGDCAINIVDLTYLVAHLFGGGPPPLPCGESASPPPGVAKPASEISLTAQYDNGVTTLTIESAIDFRGIQIELSGDGQSKPVKMVNDDIELFSHQEGGSTKIGLLDMQGSAVIKAGVRTSVRLTGEYEITDALISDLDHNPIVPTISATAKGTVLPEQFALHQNYPNPFNPVTTITFSVSEPCDYKLTIYNVLGQKVARFSGLAEPGDTEVIWDAASFASGVYLYRLEAGSFVDSKKMLLLK